MPAADRLSKSPIELNADGPWHRRTWRDRRDRASSRTETIAPDDRTGSRGRRCWGKIPNRVSKLVAVVVDAAAIFFRLIDDPMAWAIDARSGKQMIGTASSLAPAPMEGKGAYNRSSYVQEAGSSPAVPLFEQAARLAILPAPPEAIVIADYGSSQGHNSFGPMAVAIRALRERTDQDQPISIVHTDLPSSDFSALFQALANDPDSYLRADPNTFALAVGRTFYEQIVPSASVTLGWCSWAVQWLSHAPAPIPDHVQAACSKDVAVREQYAATGGRRLANLPSPSRTRVALRRSIDRLDDGADRRGRFRLPARSRSNVRDASATRRRWLLKRIRTAQRCPFRR